MNLKFRYLMGGILAVFLIIEIFNISGISYTSNNSLNQTTVPIFFNITLLTPNTNPARNSWSSLIAQELPKIGIGVTLVQAGWTIIIPRTFGYQPASPLDGIPTYANGGYDIFFIGLSNNLFPSTMQYDPALSYSSADFSPKGDNFAYFQNATMDSLISQYDQLIDTTAQQPFGYQIQQIAYQEVPYIPIVNTEEMWAHSSTLPWTQNDFLMINSLNYASYWSKLPADTAKGNNIVYENPYTLGEFMPGIVQSYIADIYLKPQISYMYERNPNDPNYALQPVMAASMPTYTTYNTVTGAENMTIKIHNGITFSNGDPMTAYDVVNTYHYAMTPGFGFTRYSDYVTYFDVGTYGNDSVLANNATSITFRLSHPYFASAALANEAVLDSRVVGWWNATDWTPSSWSNAKYFTYSNTTDFNANPATYAVFTGPYMYDQTSLSQVITTNDIKIVRNLNWWGSNSAYVGTWWGGTVPNISSLTLNFVSTKATAINDLSSGVSQVLDGQYGIVPSDLTGISGIANYSVPDFGTQMMSVNMHHPIIGTGINTPLGISNPSKAALAAKYIRQAIAYMVPQKDIITSILNGVGVEATTLWPNVGVGYDNALPVRLNDTTKAKSLMTLAGYKYPSTSSSSSSSNSNSNTTSNSNNNINSNSNPNNNVSPSSNNSKILPASFLPFFNSMEIILSFFVMGIIVRKRKILK